MSCCGQNLQFDNYIKEFKSETLPLTINRQNAKSLFSYGEDYKQITQPLVKKFIDPNHADNSSYRYDYGLRIPWTNNLIALIVQKQNFEGGDSVYDFDLLETILILYDQKGNMLLKQTVGKDNDGWLSSVHFNTHTVKKTQAKLLEFDKDEIACEVTIEEFNITLEGKLKLVQTIPIKKGKVIWDDELHDFILR